MPISEPEGLNSAAGLVVAELTAGYDKTTVLHGVDLVVRPGEIVVLVGPGGAGKTTLLHAISGLLPWSGEVRFNGRSLGGLSPRDIARRGVVHVIEAHRVFTHLSVGDNLLLAGYDFPRGSRHVRVEEALSHFPELVAKRADRAGTLSGSEQQLLAVAQGLVRRPRLLMWDEPSVGLPPALVDRVLAVAATLRQQGIAVLLVEKLVEKVLRLADRVYAMAGGKIVLQPATEPDLPPAVEAGRIAMRT